MGLAGVVRAGWGPGRRAVEVVEARSLRPRDRHRVQSRRLGQRLILLRVNRLMLENGQRSRLREVVLPGSVVVGDEVAAVGELAVGVGQVAARQKLVLLEFLHDFLL